MIKRGSTAGLHLHAPGAPSIATADLADVSACAPTSPAADEPVHLHPPGPAQAASGSISAAIEQRPWLALLCVVLVAGTVLTLGVGQRWCWSILSHCEAREPQPTASLRSVVGSQQRLQSSQRGDDARWRQATAGAAHPAAGGMATSSSFTVQRPQFLLFGDSITERGFGPGGWAAGLAHHYQRRVDVVNRGFGGYNTRWALHVAPDVLKGVDSANTPLATLFFGANDAAVPTGPSQAQHIPLDEYRANLARLVQAVRRDGKGARRVVLITPPPVHNGGRKAWQVVKHGEAQAATMALDRTLDHTRAYAQAVREAGKQLGLPVVDLYDAMQKPKDWGTLYFNDGLHLTPEGNEEVLRQLLQVLEQHFPDLKPEAMPTHLPPWDVWTTLPEASVVPLLAEARAKGPLTGVTLPSLPAAAPPPSPPAAAGATKPAAAAGNGTRGSI